jgi:hypothetical protein
MKSLPLAIGASYRISLLEIDFIRHPASCTICKRRGFYKSTVDSEFTAVDTKSTMRERFFFSGKALDTPFYCRYNPRLLITHLDQIPFWIIFSLILSIHNEHDFYI